MTEVTVVDSPGVVSRDHGSIWFSSDGKTTVVTVVDFHGLLSFIHVCLENDVVLGYSGRLY